MTPNSVGEDKWEDTFKDAIQSWVEKKSIDLWYGEGRLSFIDSLCSLGIAIHNNNPIEDNLRKLESCEIPERMSNIFSNENLVDAPLLHFGAGTDLKLVKFVVEQREVSRERVLLEYGLRNADGRNALHIALEKDQKDIVDYLLEDWIARPLTNVEKTFPSPISASRPIILNAQKHLSKIFETLPAEFPKMSIRKQCIFYFYRSMLGRWGKKDFLGSTAWLNDPVDEAIVKGVSKGISELVETLETDQDFFTACLRSQDERHFLDLIWELYGYDPPFFHQMADWATTIDFKYFVERKNTGSNLYDFQEALLKSWAESGHQKLTNAAIFLRKIQGDWRRFCKLWICHNENKSGMPSRPFTDGLKILAQQLYLHSSKEEAKAAVEFMSQLPPDSPVRSPNTPPIGTTDDFIRTARAKCFYLLASAGSGKTQLMLNTLSEHFGFFLVSGAVESIESKNLQNEEELYRAKTTGASGDTRLLFHTTRQPWIQQNPSIRSFENRCALLVECRLNLLRCVISESESDLSGFSFKPWHWLQFQLSCGSGRDSFQRIFRLSILGEVFPRFQLGTSLPQGKWNPSSQFLWCFDEVQCDLVPVFASSSTTTMLAGYFSNGAYLNRGSSFHVSSILAGTALNLHLAKAVVEEVKEAANSLGPAYFPTQITLPTFALMDTDEKFIKLLDFRLDLMLDLMWDANSSQAFEENAYRKPEAFIPGHAQTFKNDSLFVAFQDQQYQKYGIFYGKLKDEALKITVDHFHNTIQSILRSSTRLWGRYRWSVYYIEKLFQSYICNQDQGLTEMNITKASEDVRREAVTPLKRRIEALAQSTKNEPLLRDLFNMALDADLFSRSRVLRSREAAVLIQQSIGYVQEADGQGAQATQVCLVERPVVEAVLEYLREGGKLDTLVDDYIYANQFHASTIGFAAESRLAVSVNNLGTKAMPQRREFLAAFDTVHRISTLRRAIDTKLGLENYYLEKSQGVPQSTTGHVKEIRLEKWLKLVHDEAPRATFLFPSEFSGPDLFFVLKEDVPNGAKRLICSVQVKTSATEKFTADKVLHTIDPDYWYKDAPVSRNALQVELSQCLNKGNINFLSILFLGGKEMTTEEKYIMVLDFMKKRKPIKQEQSFLDALKALKTAKEKRHGGTERAKKLQEAAFQRATKNLVEARHALDLELEAISSKKSKSERKGTDYYLQILAADSVEKIFGHVFSRILEAIHSKKHSAPHNLVTP